MLGAVRAAMSGKHQAPDWYTSLAQLQSYGLSRTWLHPMECRRTRRQSSTKGTNVPRLADRESFERVLGFLLGQSFQLSTPPVLRPGRHSDHRLEFPDRPDVRRGI